MKAVFIPCNALCPPVYKEVTKLKDISDLLEVSHLDVVTHEFSDNGVLYLVNPEVLGPSFENVYAGALSTVHIELPDYVVGPAVFLRSGYSEIV